MPPGPNESTSTPGRRHRHPPQNSGRTWCQVQQQTETYEVSTTPLWCVKGLTGRGSEHG